MNQTIIIVGLILLIVYLCCQHKKPEKFCPYGYCDTDSKEYKQFMKHFKHKYPTKCNFALQGYENPYIYPYNYYMNLNHPIDKFKYPGWVRQLSLDLNKQYGFPGFAY